MDILPAKADELIISSYSKKAMALSFRVIPVKEPEAGLSDMNVATVEQKDAQPPSIAAPFWYRSLRLLLFRMDPESAHTLAIKLAPLAAGLAGGPFQDPCLATTVAGIKFSNPVGLAAGFDKNGRLTGCLSKFGFGFAEVGSITGQSSAGNPKPRLFRLVEDEAVINRLGLNGEGADVVAQRLAGAVYSCLSPSI